LAVFYGSKEQGEKMSFLDIMLMGALLTESVLLILLAHFYKKEKEKVLSNKPVCTP